MLVECELLGGSEDSRLVDLHQSVESSELVVLFKLKAILLGHDVRLPSAVSTVLWVINPSKPNTITIWSPLYSRLPAGHCTL